MKAHRNKQKAFVPVEFTLETQEEVNALYALFHFGSLTSVVSLTSAYLTLAPYKTKEWSQFYNKIYKEIG